MKTGPLARVKTGPLDPFMLKMVLAVFIIFAWVMMISTLGLPQTTFRVLSMTPFWGILVFWSFREVLRWRAVP